MSDSICLQMDVGNSSAKWRLVAGEEVLARGRHVEGDARSDQAIFELSRQPDQIWISSVASEQKNAQLADTLSDRWGVRPWFARTQARSEDLINSYQEPERMGVDRWLAMLGARASYKGCLCVIDAGSALTIDIVEANGQHRGGYIIPGAALMERALLLDTDRVRFEEQVDYGLMPGKSTSEAVRNGIACAQVGSVMAVLEHLGSTEPALFFCGGGGLRIQAALNRGGQYRPDLVFEGLALLARTSSR